MIKNTWQQNIFPTKICRNFIVYWYFCVFSPCEYIHSLFCCFEWGVSFVGLRCCSILQACTVFLLFLKWAVFSDWEIQHIKEHIITIIYVVQHDCVAVGFPQGKQPEFLHVIGDKCSLGTMQYTECQQKKPTSNSKTEQKNWRLIYFSVFLCLC